MKKYHVFVVEDDEDDYLFLKEAFDVIGCTETPRHFRSPHQLLNCLEELSTEQLPDLIVLDHQTPGLNGSETVERLRVRKELDTVALVVYTTAIAPSMRQQLAQQGVDLCLLKGSSSQETISHVKQFCELLDKRKAT